MPKEVHHGLNAAQVKTENRPGRYADGLGLYLHVSQHADPETGKRARWWLWRGTVNGKRMERGIGSARVISLAEAREIARAWRRLAHEGIDPAKERDKGKREVPTFKEAAEKVHRDQIVPHSRNPKHRDQWINTLRDYAFPNIGAMPVNAITQADILRVLSPVWTERPETAKRIRQRLRTVLDWAGTAGHREGINPVEGVDKGLPKQRHKTVHLAAPPYADVPEIVRKMAAEDTVTSKALRFAILTAARSGEVRGATWDEIDMEGRVWTIPATRMKMDRPHRVPLSDEALAILKEAEGLDKDLVFPGRRPGRQLYGSSLVDVLKRLDVPAVPHGFRSSFRDWAEECTAFPYEVKEAALAHAVRSQTERAYRRSDLYDQRRRLMDQWGRFCASASREGEVVELRR